MMLLEYVNTATDLYNTDVSDDKFVTIANNDKTCQVAVKTPWAQTHRENIHNLEIQGIVQAGLQCSVSIDDIGKEGLQNTDSILSSDEKQPLIEENV